MKFLTNSFIFAAVLWYFLRWSVNQTEERIDKIQKAAFNTPGVESPLPASVFMAGLGILAAHFLLVRRILGLKIIQSIAAAGIGVMVGTALFISNRTR